MSKGPCMSCIRDLIDIQLSFFRGSDFRDAETLESSEYFRGQTEMIADMIGVCDAKAAIWGTLKSACASSAGGADHDALVDLVMVTVKEMVNESE